MEENGVSEKHLTTNQHVDRKDACCVSARWRFTILLFAINILLYMHRVNLSLAVVCMKKDPTDIETQTTIPRNTTTQIATDATVPPGLSTINATAPFVYGINNSTLFSAGKSFGSVTKQTIVIGPQDTYHVVAGDTSNGTVTRKQYENRHCEPTTLGGQIIKGYEPELSWEKTQVSFLLSAYFYGSFFSQIPGGRFADRFGGKHVITVTMVMTAICSLLVPVCARTNIAFVFVLRILIGIAGGAVLPVAMAMLRVWAPPDERPTMIAFSFTGLSVGTIISFLTSGLLCVYGFDNGWPSIFYLQGVLTFLVTCLWCIEVASTPAQHPRISRSELEYIQKSISNSTEKAPKTIPWLSLLTSRAMWAVTIAHFCFNWSFFTVLITVPLFLKEVLKFDVRENGLFSALPYVCNMMFVLVSGKLSSVIIRKRLLGHLFTRRLFTLVGMGGFGACLVFAGHLNCELRHVSVMLLCLSCVFAGLIFGGFAINHAEFAGPFTGTVFGISNAGGVIAALGSSLSAGLLTPNGSQQEWQVVFYVAAAIDMLGALTFLVFSSVTPEPWARTGHENETETGASQQELQKLEPDIRDDAVT